MLVSFLLQASCKATDGWIGRRVLLPVILFFVLFLLRRIFPVPLGVLDKVLVLVASSSNCQLCVPEWSNNAASVACMDPVKLLSDSVKLGNVNPLSSIIPGWCLECSESVRV